MTPPRNPWRDVVKTVRVNERGNDMVRYEIADGKAPDRPVRLKLTMDEDGDPVLLANGLEVGYFDNRGRFFRWTLSDEEQAATGLSFDDRARLTVAP